MPLLRELRLASRRLVRAPLFSLATLVVLTLGIGATTVVFSIVDGVLLRPLPYPEPSALVSLSHGIVVPGVTHVEQSDATFLLYQRHNHVFDNIGAFREEEINLAQSAGPDVTPERVQAASVSASLLSVLGTKPLIGRGFVAGEDRSDAQRVVLLSERLWRKRFGGDSAVVQTRILVDGVPTQVIGVMPASFQFPSGADLLWYPTRFDVQHTHPGIFDYHAIARLRRGVSPQAAAAELDRILPRMLEEFPSDIPPAMFAKIHLHTIARPLRDDIIGDVGRLLWILFGTGAVILLIACANVANLFLVRGEARHRELAVRSAIGASRGDLLVQYFSEALLVSIAGGLIAVGIGQAAVGLLGALPEGISLPRLGEIAIDGRVLAFAAAITLATALGVSIVPLIRARTVPLATVLNDAGRASTAGRVRQRSRSALVVAQVALALVLVAGSGLMFRSFVRLRDVNPGFDSRGVLTLRVALPDAKYGTAQARMQYFDRLVAAVAAIPGVRAAGLTNWLPLGDGRDNTTLAVEDRPVPPNSVPPVHDVVRVGSNYFDTMRMPMLSGRTFGSQDVAHPTPETVVSRAFARRYWGAADALGKRLRPGIDGPWYTVVGVVGDVHLESLDKPAEDAVYMPFVMPGHDLAADVPTDVTLAVRTDGDPAALLPTVRAVVRGIDPTLPTFQEQTMSRVVAQASARTRFTMLLLGTAASVALLLGGVGIYGVMAYGVSLRRREIGVRMALGARPADVSQMISRQGVLLAAVGVGIGLAVAIGVTRFMRGLLYDVSATDPLTLAGTCVLLLLVAVFASWLPARRAASVDPAVALRSD
jgi:putative ABC transport system permease protein